jgi:hypothetical protein
VNQLLDLLKVINRALVRLGLDAETLRQRLSLVLAGGRVVDEGDVASEFGESFGGGVTETAGTAGDDGGLALHREHPVRGVEREGGEDREKRRERGEPGAGEVQWVDKVSRSTLQAKEKRQEVKRTQIERIASSTR